MISFKQYLINESKLLEGKQEFLKKYSSEPNVKDLVNKFWIIRQRLKSPQNDIDWWIKQPYDEFKKFVVDFDTSKNKETRKHDSYTKEAEKWGAVMFGKFGQYEAWFVPTYEAAVQLGRFYKGVSTKWCISTNNPNYFDDEYKYNEFIFLISDNKSLKNYQKIALQLTEYKDLDAVWDVDDENIFDDIPEFLESPINDAVYEFGKLNRSRHDNVTKSIIAKNEEYLKVNANKIIQNKLNSVKLIDKDTIPAKYKKYITSLTIPDSVTEIGDGTFYQCESLESITIPDSITEIGKWTFQYCKSLKSITIPDSVTKIGDSTFSNCESLKSINIPDSVTEIRDWAFAHCTSLESITIPDSVTEIVHGAFADCESIESITIPNSVTEIGDFIFSNCKSLKSITIPDSVTKIGNGAFSNCTSLQSITIPDSVTEIRDWAFSKCTSLESIIIPDSVTEIGKWVFCDCESLESITIPDSVTKIGDSTFSNCESLKSINIPDSVTEIRDWAFSYCKSLKSIIIPDSVTEIGGWAFEKCESLNQVIFSFNSPLLDQIKNGNYKDWKLNQNQIFIKK